MEQRRDDQRPGQQAQQGQSQEGRPPQQARQGSDRQQAGYGRQQGGQGGQGGSRQQQQFASGSGQMAGGGAQSGLAEQIREHMEVVDQSGTQVGVVDHVDGDRIKLTKASSASGQHEYIPLSQVAAIESGCVRLRQRGDTSFGMESGS